MANKKLYINPGHTNKDPGAVGYEVERKLAVTVSNFMCEHLMAKYVCDIRMKSGNITAIAEDANKWGADLIVSNHFNAYIKDQGDGYEALVYSKARLDLAAVFEKHVKATGQNIRSTKIRPDLGILRLTNMEAIINECAFVDTWKDIKDWNEDHELKVFGVALAEAAAERLDLPLKKSTKKQYTGVLPILPARGYLKRGDEGLQVKRLQRFLNWVLELEEGEKLKVDGIFGAKTLSALKAYQKAYKLEPDGLFGQKSLDKIYTIRK